MKSMTIGELQNWMILDQVLTYFLQAILIVIPIIVLIDIWRRKSFTNREKMIWTTAVIVTVFVFSAASFLYGFLYFNKLGKEIFGICIIFILAIFIARYFMPVEGMSPQEQAGLMPFKEVQNFARAEVIADSVFLFPEGRNEAIHDIKTLEDEVRSGRYNETKKQIRYKLVKDFINISRDGLSSDEWSSWKAAYSRRNISE